MPLSTDEIKTVHSGFPTDSLDLSPLNEIAHYLEPGREGTLGRLGHYDVLEVIGQGGFGIVVKAFDQTLERLVAIKILSPRFTTTSPPRRFFLREARSAAKVRHEHVVAIYNVEEAPLPFLVMEYIEGETLQDRLDREGPLELSEAVRLGRQIALGLAAAHETGLIHRDVKPANIMLEKGDSPCVKITDFGIARTADDASLSQSGVIIGTPMYMSPEQAHGLQLDHRADLFSLGSVLYTMVSGRPPFRAPTSMAVLKRVCDETPRPIQQVNPEVGAGLCSVISRLQAKSPDDRFSSAREVVTALEESLYTKPVSPTKSRKLLLGVSAVLFLAVNLALVSRAFVRHNTAGPRPNQSTNRTKEEKPAVPTEKPAVPTEKPAVFAEAAWENAVASMPVADRVPSVVAKLKALNPEFDDSTLQYEIKDGVVDSLFFASPQITNLAPLRALRELRVLRIESGSIDGQFVRSRLADLSPLRGMQLEELHVHYNSIEDLTPIRDLPLKELSLWCFAGSDLSPLRGMQLTSLNCGGGAVRDLSPLRGMPLNFLCVNHTSVEDLSPLCGMPLQRLEIEHTQVRDISTVSNLPIKEFFMAGSPIQESGLSTLQTLPLKHLTIDRDKAQDWDFLRLIEPLETVNQRPLSEFFAKVPD